MDAVVRGGPGRPGGGVGGSVADEDGTRAGSRAGDAPPKHRPGALTAGETRSVLRRVARARQRRRWAVEGVALLACLVVLISYLSSRSDPEPRDDQAIRPGGPPAGARPTGLPAADGRTGEPGPGRPACARASVHPRRTRHRRPARPSRRRSSPVRRCCR
ncbi:hypothetical protein NKG94_27950 [Micromonospora sp. M12]